MSMIRKSDKKFKWLSILERWTGCYVTGVFLLIATFGVFCDIILRKVFVTSLFGLEEIVSFSMMIITFLTISLNQRDGQHVKMDLIIEKLSPNNKRVLEICTLLMTLAIFAIITYASILYCVDYFQKGAITVLLALPLWPFYIVVPLGSLLLCLRLLVQIMRGIQMIGDGSDEVIL
jgi:TRAP-type C4-dicarboxylate transport system permease small subunit